jgi:hypothetical protein
LENPLNQKQINRSQNPCTQFGPYFI